MNFEDFLFESNKKYFPIKFKLANAKKAQSFADEFEATDVDTKVEGDHVTFSNPKFEMAYVAVQNAAALNKAVKVS